MKRILSMVAIAAITYGCKKSEKVESDNKVLSSNCLITKVKEVEKWEGGQSYLTVFDYTYNADNNLSLLSADGVNILKQPTRYLFSYSYSGNSFTVDGDDQYTYTKNSSGQITKKDEGEGTIINYVYSNGYLSKSTWSEGGTIYSTDTYTWQNGNLTKIVYKDEESGDTETTTIEYYQDKPALPNFDYVFTYIEDWKSVDYSEIPFVNNVGKGVYGNVNKNLVKTIRTESGQYNFTYDIKSNTEVVMTVQDTRLNKTNTFEILYTCK